MTDTTTGADLSASEDFAAFEASIDNPQTSEQDGGDTGAKDGAQEAAQTGADQGEEGEAPKGDAEEKDSPEGDDPPSEPQTKPKKTAQQRIDELTWKAAEAERREKAAQERLESILAKHPEPTAKRSENDAPDPSEYEFGEEDAAYIRDLTRFETKRELQAEFDRRQQEQEAERALTAARQTFEKRLNEAFPDGQPEGFRAFCQIEKVPVVLNDVIMHSESGPQLAAHYGDNPADLQRLSALPLHLQAYEIAKVEARLSGATTPATAETPKPKPKIATDAPSPAPQVRGAGGQFKVSPDTDDFAAFEKAY